MMMIATKTNSETNNEGMPPPQTIHLMSRYSLKHRKNDITSPPGPGSGMVIPFDAIAMARVYKTWTGSDRVPWMLQQQKNANTPLCIAPSRACQGNALYRLNKDIGKALLSALSPEQEGQMIPFSGKTVNLKCGTTGAPQIRLVVVFWSPSYWTATGQSIMEEDSSENNMVNLVRRFMKKHKVDVILSIAYVLPRWVQQQNDPEDEPRIKCTNSSMSFPSKFVTTAPASLAYGLWQLGVVNCMLCPDVIMSTSGDVARMVGCTGGMEVESVCTEKAKGVVGTLPSLRRDAVSTLPTIHRDLARLTGHGTCHLKHPSHRSQAAVQHLRCPHPYLLTRDLDPLQPDDALRQRDDQACFVSVMKSLADIASATSYSPTTTKGEPKHKKQKTC